MAKHILLVDGNSITHANHNANVLTANGMQVQAIFGVLKSLRALMDKTGGIKELIVLWDGKAQWRLDLFSEYKGNRVAMNEDEVDHKAAFQKQVPFLEYALAVLGIRQVRSPLLEADDLAGIMAPKLSAGGNKVTLVSGDKDWIQLVDPNVSWYDPIRDRWVRHGDFLEKTGFFNPTAFVQGKALLGDTSDNIAGIDGIGEKGAQVFLAKWGDVNRFFAAVDDGTHIPAVRKNKKALSPHPEQVLASPEGRATFQLAVRLMDLKQSRRPEQGEVISRQQPADPEKFRIFCERFAFMSILRTFDSFLAAFNIETPVTA